jgi:ABC-type bacteriocin/lantibiotic exporter with double-glycine peptidase domain
VERPKISQCRTISVESNLENFQVGHYCLNVSLLLPRLHSQVERECTMFLVESVAVSFRMSQPLALGMLMGYYSPNTKTTTQEAIIYASIIIIASFTAAVVGHYYVIQFQQIGIKVRVACSGLIYRKTLKLSRKSLNQTTLGHIVNLLSNDMHKVTRLWSAFNAIWATIPQAVIILYLLYFIAGPTALVGVVFVLILIPLQRRFMHLSLINNLKFEF